METWVEVVGFLYGFGWLIAVFGTIPLVLDRQMEHRKELARAIVCLYVLGAAGAVLAGIWVAFPLAFPRQPKPRLPRATAKERES